MITIGLCLTLSGLASPAAIVNVRVEVGDGKVIDAATVVFDKGRIRSVGKGPAPKGSAQIDGTGKVLTPGLIETLSQIGLTEIGLESKTNDYAYEVRTPDGGPLAVPGFRAADGFNPLSVRIPINREEGVTSAIAAPTGGLIAGTGAFFDLLGALEAAPDPTRPVAMFGSLNASTADAAGGSRGGLWLRLRQVFDDTRFYIKNRSAYDRGSARELSLTPLHLVAMIPVVNGSMPFVVAVDRAADILKTLRFAKAEGINVVITGAAEAWMVADAIAAARVPVIIRPTTQVPRSFDALAARDDAATLLHGAGVRLIVSSVEWDNNIRRLRQEAGFAVAYGLPRNAALRAITLTPAEVFGKSKEIGSIAARKRANMVLWSGDPLELTTVAEHIWIDGIEQPLDNRQRRLAQRYLQ